MRRRSGCRPRSRTTRSCCSGSQAFRRIWSAALDDVASRARRHPDLTVRIDDGGFLDLSGLGASGRRPFAVRGARRRRPDLGGLPARRQHAHRRPAGRRGDDMAAARVHRRRRRARSRGPWHRCGAADLTRARRRWPHLGACGPDVRPRRRRGARDQPAVGGAARAAGCGVPRGPRPSSDAGRHRRGKRSATGGAATAARERTPGRRGSGACAPWSGSAPNSQARR